MGGVEPRAHQVQRGRQSSLAQSRAPVYGVQSLAEGSRRNTGGGAGVSVMACVRSRACVLGPGLVTVATPIMFIVRPVCVCVVVHARVCTCARVRACVRARHACMRVRARVF